MSHLRRRRPARRSTDRRGRGRGPIGAAAAPQLEPASGEAHVPRDPRVRDPRCLGTRSCLFVSLCALWGLLFGPGRSRDYSLELPQIRACTLNAPGSSHCGIAVPHTTGWFRGDTLVRHGVLGVVPTPRPQRGTPFAPRGPGGPFPRLNTTMGHCDSLPPISPRFVSFAWRYHRCVPCSSPSAQDLESVP